MVWSGLALLLSRYTFWVILACLLIARLCLAYWSCNGTVYIASVAILSVSSLWFVSVLGFPVALLLTRILDLGFVKEVINRVRVQMSYKILVVEMK